MEMDCHSIRNNGNWKFGSAGRINFLERLLKLPVMDASKTPPLQSSGLAGTTKTNSAWPETTSAQTGVRRISILPRASNGQGLAGTKTLSDHSLFWHWKVGAGFGIEPAEYVQATNGYCDVGLVQWWTSALFPVLDILQYLKFRWLPISSLA